MRNNNLMFVIAIACLCFMHCATTRAPSGWLSDPDNVGKDVYGGWVDVTSRQGLISGELIAVERDSVYVAKEHLRAIAVADVLDMRITVFDAGSKIALGTFGGTVLALSNGLWFLLTGPMWIIGGSIAAIYRSYDPVYDFPSSDLRSLALFARFPQGLPASLDRNSIKAKVRK
ncbi:MAG: hypothetical protein A2X66_09645 [Ignavibacteria bacterium GWA2_54_16]|nr:MAG: hypothetical protein A2X66_09645 [Ignavibacteria bacterium GWA2_54_16]